MEQDRWGRYLDQPHPQPETLEGFSSWQEIGRGGDATVYRAVQDALKREVAIKVLMMDDAESIRRFTREVQLMVALGREHPNIAKVLQIGTSSLGRPCIVMDYYELGSLDRRLAANGPLSVPEVLKMGAVIADALSFAHDRGVLHRDVKPQNILILPTSYVLSDFGIARLIDSANTASTDRFSYRHASPQVLDGLLPSAGDDVWSLGATLFHLLDGKPPFTSPDNVPDSALAYIKRVREEEPRPLTRPDVPPELTQILRRSLRKDPTERISSAAEFRDLLSALRARSVGWAPPSPMSSSLPSSVPSAPRPTDHLWGGVAGQTHSTEDLTALPPLPATPRALSAYSAAELPADEPPRKLPLATITTLGVAVGVILVLVYALLGEGPNTKGGGSSIVPATPAVTTTPSAPKSSSGAIRDPRYAPRNLRIAKDDKTEVEVVWDDPEATPGNFIYGVGPSQDTIQILNAAPGRAGTKKARITGAQASWPRVCVLVSGISDKRIGSATTCVNR